MKRKRRSRFYYEIHLRGGLVTEGVELWSGMLEAEREVTEKANKYAQEKKRAQRGFLIRRITRAHDL